MATRVEPGTPSSVRPSGTVTFLFSDIEGSTERWESDRRAMSAAVARHDVLVRAALEARGGYVFKTVGDEFCAAFVTASDAITAALDVQRALSAEDFSAVNGLRIRMAVHTGTVDERDGDYFGPTVNRVARLLAIGHGGQVLLSGATAGLLGQEMPPETTLRDLGEHRLRDLTRPERIYQLVTPDLTQEFPALRSLDALPNNLPVQLTSFVGRESEVAEIEALIRSHRLVTVVGTGGAGKTRCAIQAAADLLEGSGDGVWLVELGPVADPAFVANAVAQTLSLQEQPNRPVLDTLLAYLKRKRLLLILDNCEHLIGEVCTLVSALVQACPDVYILATSREPLNVSGEETYRIPSLSIPSSAEVLIKEGTSAYGAIQLFADRAFSSDKRFALSEENAPHVTEICRRLDGIPLAIELAAARVKVLSPKQLAQRLDERFRLLTGGNRSSLPRQQTMRALIDWSYDLLSNDERALLRKVSTFAGGFTLETAAAVCSESDVDEIIVLDLLTSLVDKSLVQADETEGATRYRLLESTRQYAREKLSEAGEKKAATRAHAAAFLALAEQLDCDYETTPDGAWRAQVEPEMENFRTALLWAFGPEGDALAGGQLAGALRWEWYWFAVSEGRRWVEASQQRLTADAPIAVPAALDLAEAQLSAALAQYKASRAAGERALAQCREIADARGIAMATSLIGRTQILLGNVADGEAMLAQALEAFRSLCARKSVAYALSGLATARAQAGDIPAARARFSEALAAARAAGAERYAATIAFSLSETEFRGGDAGAALRLADEALAASSAFGDSLEVTTGRCNLAAYLAALSRFDEARVAAREAVTASRDAQWFVVLAFALQHLAAVAALRPGAGAPVLEDLRRAARILGYTGARLAALEAVREYTEQQEYDAMIPALRDALGEAELALLMAEAATWSEDQAVTEAMLV